MYLPYVKASPAVRFATIRGERLLKHACFRRVQVPASPLLGHCKLLNYLPFFFHPEASGNILKLMTFPPAVRFAGFYKDYPNGGGEAITP